MTHKEFIASLSEHLELSKGKTSSLARSLVDTIRSALENEDVAIGIILIQIRPTRRSSIIADRHKKRYRRMRLEGGQR